MIGGVVIKKLVTHSDDRGYFREIIPIRNRLTGGTFIAVL